MSPYLKAYNNQRGGALARGIDWEFTFESWLAWWGADIEQRGVGPGALCMMRRADAGPYSPDNCSKGDAAANARTAGALKRKRAADKAKAEREANLNALMWTPSAPPEDEDERSKHERSGTLTSAVYRYNYRG